MSETIPSGFVTRSLTGSPQLETNQTFQALTTSACYLTVAVWNSIFVCHAQKVWTVARSRVFPLSGEMFTEESNVSTKLLWSNIYGINQRWSRSLGTSCVETTQNRASLSWSFLFSVHSQRISTTKIPVSSLTNAFVIWISGQLDQFIEHLRLYGLVQRYCRHLPDPRSEKRKLHRWSLHCFVWRTPRARIFRRSCQETLSIFGSCLRHSRCS